MKNTVLIIAALLVVGLLGIFIGRRLSARYMFAGRVFPNRQFVQPMARMHGRMGDGFGKGLLQGQISKIDNDNVTIQRADGTTYTITLNDNTVINKETKGGREDLQTGQNITVYGSSSYGGYMVNTVVINP